MYFSARGKEAKSSPPAFRAAAPRPTSLCLGWDGTVCPSGTQTRMGVLHHVLNLAVPAGPARTDTRQGAGAKPALGHSQNNSTDPNQRHPHTKPPYHRKQPPCPCSVMQTFPLRTHGSGAARQPRRGTPSPLLDSFSPLLLSRDCLIFINVNCSDA